MDAVDLTLVLGGTRSGKSAYAETILARAGGVTYVAPTQLGKDDRELLRRVQRHRERRPDTWHTHEVIDLEELVGFLYQKQRYPVLLDSFGSLVARAMEDWDEEGARAYLLSVIEAIVRSGNSHVVVSEEVGLSLHPLTKVGRDFVDLLGMCNQRIAKSAKDVVLIVAGLPLVLKGSGSFLA
ncbi:adenosylcobinamide kinase /adenosylcobinamide-phosphate guanylyltransferase [Ferrithrix thermotolerans DSM 19514]|uniref:Adenosylcobinamide kinase n=1 Tax=Ferrithrix thermotolerans DSM 19514 TaxID=1121881 RepID=A0A1M4VKJ2_9ACTN|nr:bifunctional adenosylcobinamide kinase/adenosylcobinamide-phosphate guanylyltransferase [Ferrithrix thermotolerans]SHE69504.1 adenosylcobinamide kinase /adenosylcobinamide-phosphate guanylyltransferase [Ferrithrix thermotolerans DSM 19514]